MRPAAPAAGYKRKAGVGMAGYAVDGAGGSGFGGRGGAGMGWESNGGGSFGMNVEHNMY